MRYEIKRISPRSLAGILGTFYFLAVAIVSLVGILGSLSDHAYSISIVGLLSVETRGLESKPNFVASPFVAALVGALHGWLIAKVYNVITTFAPGLQISATQVSIEDAGS